ncbi:hypothetical protein BS17DRAFT_860642 [Gyrodon lividus]|nr:hypothetical protein BS17DRAFT_860642 [Gyrodon lividus]
MEMYSFLAAQCDSPRFQRLHSCCDPLSQASVLQLYSMLPDSSVNNCVAALCFYLIICLMAHPSMLFRPLCFKVRFMEGPRIQHHTMLFVNNQPLIMSGSHLVTEFSEDTFAKEDRLCQQPACDVVMHQGDPCFYIAPMDPSKPGRYVCAGCYTHYKHKPATTPQVQALPDPQAIHQSVSSAQSSCLKGKARVIASASMDNLFTTPLSFNFKHLADDPPISMTPAATLNVKGKAWVIASASTSTTSLLDKFTSPDSTQGPDSNKRHHHQASSISSTTMQSPPHKTHAPATFPDQDHLKKALLSGGTTGIDVWTEICSGGFLLDSHL